MGLFDNAGVLYDIDDAMIFASNADGTFGTKYDVPSINLFRIEYVSKSALGRGDGGITVVASAIESANITIQHVSIADAVLDTAFPSTQSESDNTLVTDMEAGLPYPYFGMLVRSFDAENTDGGTIIFVPRIKITGNVQWELGDNVIVTPEITGMAIQHPTLASLGNRKRFVRTFRYESNIPSLNDFTIPA